MRVRWLGWAGVEIEAAGASVVIDPLRDPGATFAALGDAAAGTPLPAVVAPRAEGTAVAGLVTHLHRDHADAGALATALADDAPLMGPPPGGGNELENLAVAQAAAELAAAGLELRPLEAWDVAEAGPFTVAALPAVDGTGDPQVSWVVEAEGRRVLHLGDTLFHGYWWRMALRRGPFDVVFAPVNGAVLDFPHRHPSSPLPGAMDPEQAALAGELLGAHTVIPMHYGGYDIEPWYRPVGQAEQRFAQAAAGRPYEARLLEVGEELELEPERAGEPSPVV
jgi:L-ascorbate metabolism protein UlaG (beta-lactamase superfamily)